MKITNAFIDDPTVRGELEFPELVVVVDGFPDVTIPPQDFSGGWTVGKYGPFVKYSSTDVEPIDAGDFNVRFRSRFPVVVDITLRVDTGIESIDLKAYSLPLTRARQLVRKHASDWRILINDHAAERGSLLWMPVQMNPSCRVQVDGHQCDIRPTRMIRVSEVDVAMCVSHVQDHNDKHAAKRTAKAS